MPSTKPEIIAHRGLHELSRENTQDAFERAVSAGADAVELDVHATTDGIVVVHHDFGIPSPRGAVALRSVNLEDARTAARDHGFELPTLADVLLQLAGRLKVYIEVKAPDIELEVARIIRSSQCELAVHSFDHRIVKKIRDFVPGLQTGVLTVSRPVDPVSLLRDSSSVDYWPQYDFVDAELINHIHEFGGRVIAWTANHPAQWERLTSLGVDGICTDAPDKLAAWRS